MNQNIIFQGNSNVSNPFLGNNNNNNQVSNNIFSQNQQSNNSNNNIYNSQANRNSMFSNQNNQGNNNSNNQGNSYGNNYNQNQSSMFNQNNQGNNIFSNNNQNNQGSNNNFNNNNNNPNNNNNQNNNNFNNNNQNSNNFNQNNQQNQNWNNNFSNQFYLSDHLQHFLKLTTQQQAEYVHNMKKDQIARFLDICMKSLVEPSKLQRMTLSDGNVIRNQKVRQLAARLNIIKQLIQLKKQVKDNVVSRIDVLKKHNEAIVKAKRQLAQRLSQKLLNLKKQLIQATTESKMVHTLKQQVEQIDSQLRQFLRPLYNSNQIKTSYNFIDPDHFCVKISQRILKNIILLDNKMDELLACESQPSKEAINISETIEQLIEYYENVAISLKKFSEKFGKIKRQELTKRRGSPEGGLDHIKKKSLQKVQKQLTAYNLLKQVEKILQERQKQKTIP